MKSTSRRLPATWLSRCSPAASSPGRKKLSAAELAAMFHIYFLGSSEGLVFDVADSNFDTALWNPLGSTSPTTGYSCIPELGSTPSPSAERGG